MQDREHVIERPALALSLASYFSISEKPRVRELNLDPATLFFSLAQFESHGNVYVCVCVFFVRVFIGINDER